MAMSSSSLAFVFFQIKNYKKNIALDKPLEVTYICNKVVVVWMKGTTGIALFSSG
jgi:hypothetical protein